MRKLILTSTLISGLWLFGTSCQQPSQEEQELDETYLSVKTELQNNLEICKVDTDGLYVMDGQRVIPDFLQAKEAIFHYNKLVDALSSEGISLEFTRNLDLPSDCHFTDLALKFNFGASSILSSLWDHLTYQGQLISGFKKYKTKVDVIRISISSRPTKELFALNDENIKNPTAYVVEIDPITGLSKRVFTMFVNPGSRTLLFGSQIYDMTFDFSKEI